jgi:hypothetical protein
MIAMMLVDDICDDMIGDSGCEFVWELPIVFVQKIILCISQTDRPGCCRRRFAASVTLRRDLEHRQGPVSASPWTPYGYQ